MASKKILLNILIITILFSFTLQIDIEAVKDYFKSFLQQKVPNRVLMAAIQMLRTLTPFVYPGNLKHNKEKFPNHLSQIQRYKGYIEDQQNYGDLKYGHKTIAYSGCELIAAYNALYDLTGDENIDFPTMIHYFENDGILLYGHLGTAPQAVDLYFRRKGFQTKRSVKREDYTNIEQNYETFILTKYNDIEDITQCIHTVCITKKNEKFYVHNNSYYGHNIQYDSIEDILNRIDGGLAKDIVLLGIRKK